MNTRVDNTSENTNQAAAISSPKLQNNSESSFQFADNRPEAIALRKLQESINNSPRVQQLQGYQEMADNSPHVRQLKAYQAMADNYSSRAIQRIEQLEAEAQKGKLETIPKKENKTGLPDNLKSGVENLSGMSMDDVKVHYNSDKPAKLQAHAYAQGTDIHLASGQEKHLPHEAWHVVQQKEGRVKPTLQMKNGVNVNDDAGLEKEADVMGAKALQMQSIEGSADSLKNQTHVNTEMIQMVRQQIQFPAGNIDLTFLENAIIPIDAEIAALESTDPEEAINGWIDLNRIREWRAQYNENIQALQDLRPGDASFPLAEIRGRSNAVLERMYRVLVTVSNLGGTLNKSLNEYTEDKANKEAANQAIADSQKESGDKAPRVKEKTAVLTPTRQGPLGLGTKWGAYNQKLRYAGNTRFIQYVPADASTIEKAISSQKITDAVFHTGKAFWLAVEGAFEIASSAGKVKMIYTFSPAGAQSLMEDYLICGSGDFAEDNEETWVGEAQHPNYTIWKTNELGAYGVGASRLANLESSCIKIEREK